MEIDQRREELSGLLSAFIGTVRTIEDILVGEQPILNLQQLRRELLVIAQGVDAAIKEIDEANLPSESRRCSEESLSLSGEGKKKRR